MKGFTLSRLVFICCSLTFFFVLVIDIARAHVGADDMPDSVAEVEYRIYLEFKPNDPMVLNKLGMVYYRLNKLTEAVREFTTVLKRDPDNYDALDGMGLVRAAQQEYDEAISYHRQAIAINPDDMMTHYHLGSVLEKKGSLQEAIEEYRLSLELFNQQYPSTTENKKAAEFGVKVRKTISDLESML